MRALILTLFLMPAMAQAADPHAAAKALIATQCSACHRVPGVPEAVGDMGPSLKGIAKQPLIAGNLPNNQANMIRWLMHPQQVSPGSAMPDLGLTEDQARALTAYLYTLDEK